MVNVLLAHTLSQPFVGQATASSQWLNKLLSLELVQALPVLFCRSLEAPTPELTLEERRLARLIWHSLQHGDRGSMEALEKAPWKVRAAILDLWDKLRERGQNPFDQVNEPTKTH